MHIIIYLATYDCWANNLYFHLYNLAMLNILYDILSKSNQNGKRYYIFWGARRYGAKRFRYNVKKTMKQAIL